MNAFLTWIQNSWLARLTADYTWCFAAMEVLHFIGLCLLIGSLCLIDLRILGFAKRLSVPAVHDLLPWAFVGFGINFISGIVMFANDVHLYASNLAFWAKMILILVAGLNAVLFKRAAGSDLAALDVRTPSRVKGIAAASLLLWISVICAGRLLPYLGTGGG